MQVLIAHDFSLVREGLKVLFRRHFEAPDIHEVSHLDETLFQLATRTYDLLLLDAHLLHTKELEMLDWIRFHFPQVPVLLMNFNQQHAFAVMAFKSGIRGYLTRDDITEGLPDAVRKVLAGGRYITPFMAEQLAAAVNENAPTLSIHERLSEREWLIMQMLSRGVAPKRIAYDLNLSIKTISTYRARALRKMNMQSNAEFIRYVLQHNLIS